MNWMLALASTVLSLVLVEGGMRLYSVVQGPATLEALEDTIEMPESGVAKLGHLIRPSSNDRIIYELRPGISAFYQGAWIEINDEGYRGRGVPIARTAGVVRVIGIGDSFMFGQGVAEGSTYLDVLRNLLAEVNELEAAEVINLAVPGYNTAMEVETLERRGLKLKPDVVIIEFVGNDLSLPNFVKTRDSPFSLRRSFLVDAVRRRATQEKVTGLLGKLRLMGLEAVRPRGPNGLRRTEDPSLVPAKYRELVGWDGYTRAMKRLQRLSQEHSFAVLSVSQAPGRGSRKTRALRISHDLGFHVLDIGEIFGDYLEERGMEYLGSPLSLNSEDGHPSAQAHGMAANAIFDYMVQEGIATPDSKRKSSVGESESHRPDQRSGRRSAGNLSG